ncbi:esterase B1 [Aedes aegypti]|uniref:Carboxylic ester hydrolase n=1 Tax=Aedes aegypti TaxID=7159 RepID=A0A0P6IYI7_AEDAE|nr:esterase B1 [Aedes aegypti]
MWAKLEVIIILCRVLFHFALYKIANKVICIWPWLKRPIVELKQGSVQGVTSKLPNGKSYHCFKGIPYAKSPVGKLRFRPPIPLEKFETTPLDCSVDKGLCVQDFFFCKCTTIGTEDVLYLNVFTPSLPSESSERLPVMVYIHGGGFRYGTANAFICDMSYLVEQGVVVVTVYYRLGPLGFLCLPRAGITGNAGLKDQLLALRWVKQNIAQFGGDADNVTLFGHSAGSWGNYLHYLSPNSRKYFHRVICISGDSSSKAEIQTSPETNARMLARAMGCKANNDNEILDFLTNASPYSIAKHQDGAVSRHEEGLFQRFVFRPVAEEVLTDDSIITKDPEETLREFNSLRMPIMTGLTSAEGMLAIELNKTRLEKLNQHPEWLAPRFLVYSDDDQRVAVGNRVKSFYLHKKDIGWDTINETCKMMSDLTFVGRNILSAELLAKYQPNVTHYHFSFAFLGRYSIFSNFVNHGKIEGACHSDDIFYMNRFPGLPKLSEQSDEHKVRNIYVKLLTNFAKFSNPTPHGCNLGFTWSPVQPVAETSAEFNLDTLEIRPSPIMIRNNNESRLQFIRSLIKENKKGVI